MGSVRSVRSKQDRWTRSLVATARDRRGLTAVVIAALLLGLALRIVIYRSSIGRLDGDEATWGLMVRAAVHGHLSAFFWSQAYGGTQEVVLVTPLFAIFGTHLFLMRLVSTLLGALAAIVVWRLGRRTIGELPGLAAGLLLWVWPPYLLWKLEIWGGFYGSGLLYTAIILLLVLRLAEAPTKRAIALTGLVLGLAFWESLQTVAVAVPALLWLTVRRPRIWLSAWLALPGAALGASPWIASNLRHDWWSFRLPSAGVPYATKLHGYVSATFPMILGLRVPFRIDWLFGAVPTGAVYVALVLVFLVAAWRLRRTPLSLFVVVIALYPLFYSSSGLTWLTREPRYVVLVLPAVALLAARAATSVPRVAALLGVAALLSVAGLVRWIEWSHATAAQAALDPERVSVRPAIAALERAGIDRAYANYWLADRITFETRERIIVSEGDMNHLVVAGPRRVLPPLPTDYTTHHHPAYDAAVRRAPRHAYLLVRDELGAARDARLLLAHGYRERRIGTVLMFVSPRQAPA